MAIKPAFKLKVMADYGCFPLWDATPTGPRNLDPSELPISEDLAEELGRWAARYDRTLNRNDPPASGFPTSREHLGFVEEGRHLASRLAKELGSTYLVLYFNDLVGRAEAVPDT